MGYLKKNNKELLRRNHMKKTGYIFAFVVGFCFSCGGQETPDEITGCKEPSACADLIDSPCAGCPQPVGMLCEEGECIERAEDAVDVVVNVMLETGEMTNSTTSLVYVVATQEGSASELICSSALLSSGALVQDLNILSSGYKNVSGGSYHENLSLGRCPDMPILIIVWGTDGVGGLGASTGQGCVEIAASSMVDEIPLINLN